VHFWDHHHNWHQLQSTPALEAALVALKDVVSRMPLFIFPNKTNKSEKVKGHAVLQSVLNAWLEAEFSSRGWHAEFPVQGHESGGSTGYRVDFALLVEGKYIMVEVEFGNRARIDSDLRKLLDAHHWERLHFGVIITPKNTMANITTGGSATFEQVVNDVSSCHPNTVPHPLYVMGLDHREAVIVDMSKSKIRDPELLSGNGDKRILHHVVAEHRRGVPVEDLALPDATSAASAQQNRNYKAAPVAQQALF
jgi:hypothetical protein